MQEGRKDTASLVRSGVLWTGLQSGLGLVLGLLRVVLLARLVPPADHGRFAVAASVVAIAFPLYSLVGERAYITLAPKSGSDTAGLLRMVRWASSVAATVLVLAAFSAQALGDWNDALPLGLLAVATGALATGQARLAKHAVEFRFRWAAVARFLSSSVVHTAVAVVLALAGAGLWALVGGAVAEAVALNLLSRVGKAKSAVGGPSVREILALSVFMLAARVVGQAALNADNLIAAFGLGASEAGYYTRAYALASVPQGLIAAMIARVLLPVLSSRSSNPVEFGEAIDATVVRSLSLLLPVSVSVFFEAERVVVFLLGADWSRAGLVLSCLAPAIMFRGLAAIAVSSLDSRGRVRRTLGIQCVYAFAVVVGAGIGVQFGLVGLAVGTAVATGVHAFASWALAVREHEGGVRALCRGFALAAPWALVLMLLEQFGSHGLPRYLMWTAHGVVVALAFMFGSHRSRSRSA